MSPIRTLASKSIARIPQSRVPLIVIFATVVLLFPVINRSPVQIDILSNALIYVILALGLNVMLGYAGLLNLGFAAFFAIGAYGYGILASTQFEPSWSPLFEPLQALGLVSHVADPAGGPGLALLHFNFWLMLVGGGVLAAAAGFLFGMPSIRLRGDYFAVVTLGLSEMVPVIARQAQTVTGGAGGISNVATPTLLGYSFGLNPVPYYYLLLGLVAFALLLSHRLQHSRVGRSWRALQQDELAATCMGIDQGRLKLLASTLGAGFGGVAGVVWMAKVTTASPTAFLFPVSMAILMMVVLGGAGSIIGVAVSAVFVSLLQSIVLPGLGPWVNGAGSLLGIPALETLQVTTAIPFIFGLVLVAVILYRPDGIFPSILRATRISDADRHVTPGLSGDVKISRISEPTGPGPILEVSGLAKHYGGLRALDDLTVSVQTGEILGIIGPNGAGKTTFFNLLTGLDERSAGAIRFRNEDIAGLPPHDIADRGLLRTFQSGRSFPTMTVLENLLVGQERHLVAGTVASVLRTPGMLAEERHAREWALEVLSIFGNRLLPRVGHPASSLSYANRRRLEIARALAGRPYLLLLDEPTAGMNPAETIELTDQMSQFPRLGVTLIVIEHKIHVVTGMCSRVIVLNFGQKIAEGQPDAISRDPAVLEAYLGKRQVIGQAASV